jgi:hypothetical protein
MGWLEELDELQELLGRVKRSALTSWKKLL